MTKLLIEIHVCLSQRCTFALGVEGGWGGLTLSLVRGCLEEEETTVRNFRGCGGERSGNKMSSHLCWSIIRNNNAYLLKKRNIRKPFSTEPNNLVNLSSYKYNGIIHKRSVGVIAAPDNKGFTVVYKKGKAVNKPAKSSVKRTLKAGPRRSLYKLKRLMNCNRYRRDLVKATLRRASAVIKSQKPLPVKKARSKKTD